MAKTFILELREDMASFDPASGVLTTIDTMPGNDKPTEYHYRLPRGATLSISRNKADRTVIYMSGWQITFNPQHFPELDQQFRYYWFHGKVTP